MALLYTLEGLVIVLAGFAILSAARDLWRLALDAWEEDKATQQMKREMDL